MRAFGRRVLSGVGVKSCPLSCPSTVRLQGESDQDQASSFMWQADVRE